MVYMVAAILFQRIESIPIETTTGRPLALAFKDRGNILMGVVKL